MKSPNELLKELAEIEEGLEELDELSNKVGLFFNRRDANEEMSRLLSLEDRRINILELIVRKIVKLLRMMEGKNA